MIQRVQSIFLAAIALLMIIFCFPSLWTKYQGETVVAQLTAWNLSLISQEKTTTHFAGYIGILALIAAALAVFSLSRYNNRILQLKLNLINTLVLLAVLGAVIYQVFRAESWLGIGGSGSFTLTVFFPATGLVLNKLANVFIRRDEQLVRSADRLRD